MQCSCDNKPDLIEIGQNYTEFVSGMRHLEAGDWVKLLQCVACGQLWRTDEWDKYQTPYACKLVSREEWKSTDVESLIKESMVKNHGGLDTSLCLANNCQQYALKGRAYCV